MEIAKIAAYTTAAQSVLFDYVTENKVILNQEFETTSPFRSIAMLLAHSIGAETRWISRINGVMQIPRYELTAPDSVEGLQADWRSHRDKTLMIVRQADHQELARKISYSFAGSNKVETHSVEDMLFHVFNHEQYHRGQCSMALQMFKLDPPNFDYVFFA